MTAFSRANRFEKAHEFTRKNVVYGDSEYAVDVININVRKRKGRGISKTN